MKLLLVLFLGMMASCITAREVTHEDIKDAMLTLVNIVKQVEDKLERHEYREKALGDQLKRLFAGLEKRHKGLEPLKGAISRLDERLSSVETILIQKDEREKQQNQKIIDTMDSFKSSLQTWRDSVVSMVQTEIKKIPPPVVDNRGADQKLAHLDDKLTKKLDTLASNLEGIKKETHTIKDKQSKMEDCKKSNTDEQTLNKHLANTENLLTKYDRKLSEFEKNITKLQKEVVPLGEISLADEAWHNKMTEALEKQQQSIQNIQKSFMNSEELIKSLPTQNDLVKFNNKTLDVLRDVQYDIKSSYERELSKITSNISNMNKDSGDSCADFESSIRNITTEHNLKLLSVLADSNEKLQTDIQSLSKMERVVLQTADNVLDQKKRLEYGILQIIREIENNIKSHHKDLNSTIHSKFDTVQYNVLENQTAALFNISKVIEKEISQVWRQIGIMYQQMTTSNVALDRIQAQTEQYVNGTMNTMEGMEGKVGQITSRMAEVDENLNFLLGRLSLVTQEFNQIKTGLGKALDEIKETFLEVQSKIKSTKDEGPGPHYFSSEKED